MIGRFLSWLLGWFRARPKSGRDERLVYKPGKNGKRKH